MTTRQEWRTEHNQEAETLALLALSRSHGEWIGSIAAADLVGMKTQWKVIACALLRLERKGRVESNIIRVQSRHRIYENRRVFRIKQHRAESVLPDWLAPTFGYLFSATTTTRRAMA